MKFTIGIITLAIFALIFTSGLRFNFTDSAPRGIWAIQDVEFSSLWRGKIVAVCPPALPLVKKMGEQGLLPYGYCPETEVAPLLKAVGAVEGDIVTIRTGKPVMVNGEELPNTIAKNTGVAWPDGEYIVKRYQVWVFSTYNPNSFDSRYFGPVDPFSIKGEAIPLFTDGNYGNMRLGLL